MFEIRLSEEDLNGMDDFVDFSTAHGSEFCHSTKIQDHDEVLCYSRVYCFRCEFAMLNLICSVVQVCV